MKKRKYTMKTKYWKVKDPKNLKVKNKKNPFAFMNDKTIHKSNDLGLCPNALVSWGELIRKIWFRSSRESYCDSKFILPITKKIAGSNMIQSYDIDQRPYADVAYMYLVVEKPKTNYPNLYHIYDPSHKFREAFTVLGDERDYLKPELIERDKKFLKDNLPKIDGEYTIYRITKKNLKRLIWKLMYSYDGGFVKTENTEFESILTPLTSIENTNILNDIKYGYMVMKNSDVYEMSFDRTLEEVIK